MWDAKEPASYLKSIMRSRRGRWKPWQTVKQKEGFSEEAFREFITHVGETDYEKEEPWYRWNVTFPVEQIQERVVSQYPEIGEIQEFSVKKRSDGGAVRELELAGERKEKKVFVMSMRFVSFFLLRIFRFFEGMGQRAEA